MSTQKILLGTLSGLAAGIAIGILAAPASGDETRKKLADSAGDLKKKLMGVKTKVQDGMESLGEKFQNEAEGLGNDITDRAKKAVHAAKDGYRAVKNEALS